MTATAIAAFVRLYQGATTYESWQNFFIDKTVNGYEFKSFDVGEISMNRTADEGGTTLTLPATAELLALFERALEQNWLADIVLYEFSIAGGLPIDLTGAVEVAKFLGEVVTMTTNLVELQVMLGTAMDAISGEIPGRRITTSLVGRLPTL